MKSLLLAILILGAMFGEDTSKPKFTDPAISQYTKSIEDIDMDAVKKKREVRNKTVTALDASIKRAMSAGDLDKAIWLREEKTRISQEWVPSDGELIGEKAGIPMGTYIVKAKCDDSAIIYVNEKQLLTCGVMEVTTTTLNVSGPIVITVKCISTGGPKGFSFQMTTKDGQEVLTTSNTDKWKSFKPKNEKRWFDRVDISSLSNAIKSETPVRAENIIPIWADHNNDTCYLVFGK
jgi:hypothetical protein